MATSLVNMERALVEVPHVRLVPFAKTTNLRILYRMVHQIMSRSLRVVRLTFHFRFGFRWVSLFSLSHSSTHRSVISTVSGLMPRCKHNLIYSSYHIRALTLNASFGKRHMILTLTECRTSEYHMKNPSRTYETNRGLPPPVSRLRFQF